MALRLLVPWFLFLHCSSRVECKTVNIVVILPTNEQWLFCLQRVLPAIRLAMDNLPKISNLTFSVKSGDSKCSIAHGIKASIDLYMQTQIDVFFGPVCDYAAGPLVRQAKFWNIPVITAGSMAMDFSSYRFETYPTLTRVGPVNFSSLFTFFLRLFKSYEWTRFVILYSKSAYSNIVTNMCHLTIEALHYNFMEKRSIYQQRLFKYDPGVDINRMLQEEVTDMYAEKKRLKLQTFERR
ncbi:atrial natriuretic peptide receptor 3 [Octopus sinensis]|nr:atrial natriuretic peptide receptor 3 [Octopus sinensis]